MTMTPSTIWRSMSGTMVWQTLESAAADQRQHQIPAVQHHVAPQPADPTRWRGTWPARRRRSDG